MITPPLTPRKIQRLQARYRELATQMGNFESLSQGSVMPQPPSAWRWTRKVRGKTVTRGLSPAQAEEMKRAIANHRALEKIIDEMREITQNLILEFPKSTTNRNRKNSPKGTLT